MISVNKRFNSKMSEISREEMPKISYTSATIDKILDRLNEENEV